MDRIVDVVYKGKTYRLNYSLEIMFDMTEKYGVVGSLMDLLRQDSREGFEMLRWLFVRMAADGELVRRGQGYAPEEMLSEDDVTVKMTVREYSEIKMAVITAISKSYLREIEAEEEDIDVGLQELNEKKTNA